MAAPAGPSRSYDVLVLGEVLVEIHADTALRAAADGTGARISYSGDALNAAAAARRPRPGPPSSRSSATTS